MAKLYNVEINVLNQTIKRNINRFPETFCFRLTDKEINNTLYTSKKLFDKITLICYNNTRKGLIL